MSARSERLAGSLVLDLQQVFARRLLSVAIHGQALEEGSNAPLQSAAVVSTLTYDDLESCARTAGRWKRQGIDAPLLLPDREFRRSLDAFPLEHAELLASAIVVFGPHLFDGVTIAAEDIRRACERQVLSHLLHLREGYIEAGGDPRAIAGLVSRSAPAFAALLRSVARLLRIEGHSAAEAGLSAAAALGLAPEITRSVVDLADRSGVPSADAARIFPDYLNTVERLAHAVDTWRP